MTRKISFKSRPGVDGMPADDDTTLSARLRQLVGELRARWREPDARIEALNGELVELARDDPTARRPTSIPGVGVPHATALIAAAGNASCFAKARDLGVWPGLVLRHHTTGGKPWLPGIFRRGNTYLHTLLVHGARGIAITVAERDPTGTLAERDDPARRSSQCCRGRRGQQAGADCPGSPAQGRKL
ncbi:transposase [Geminicoccaceae bacterium 1502E]|nr:transposase [Geminicoccaceae bacterium 1502E]